MIESVDPAAGDGVLRERLAVMGSPIAHSQSPAIHAAAYHALGLDWSYGAIRCEAAELEGFLTARGAAWRGLSLTMPLKEEAHRISRVLDPVAQESGVANTLLRIASDTSGAPSWAGFNTDVHGLAAAITDAGLDASSTVVIGSGATAVSAVLAARRLGAAHVEILARNVSAISDLVARFGDTAEHGGAPLHVFGTPLLPDRPACFGVCAPDPTLVISTLPGPAAEQTQVPVELLDIPLFDVAYDPWPSPLAERWRRAGGIAHAGIGMLVHQAIAQVRIFHGGDPTIALPEEDRVLAAMQRAVSAANMGG